MLYTLPTKEKVREFEVGINGNEHRKKQKGKGKGRKGNIISATLHTHVVISYKRLSKSTIRFSNHREERNHAT